MRNGLLTLLNGTKYWYRNDKLHREEGPAVEYPNGNKYWYYNGYLHRENGPAVEGSCGEYKEWRHHGYMHRLDGPAFEYLDIKKWYYHGEAIACSSQQEFDRLIKLKLFW
jgi:hypothetical protein